MSLPIIFVAVSVIELLVLAAVEDRIGLGPTLAIILFTGILGASLVRSQGFGVLVRVRQQMSQGVFPGRELAHGALVLIGGALLLTPGFLTDALGFALMVPALREMVRLRGTRFLQRRAPF
ncbi:MAG: FxsA family protein [Acidimicrobiia bacterium]|nr:FxsA family protein [Acidimicrobiia bacterium]